jgi:Fur family transcriptional regulator, ferric uptake regulator
MLHYGSHSTDYRRLLQICRNNAYTCNMLDQLTPLLSVLQSNNKRVTSARIAVYEALRENEPLTMSELIELCELRTDRASVYRTVELFEQLGVIQRLQIGWKYKLELGHKFSYHHHHLTCQLCGVVIALSEDDLLEQRLLLLSENIHFQMTDHQIEIHGLCEKCQAKL